MTEDVQWLRQFVEEGSERAFECLVGKYVDLVYSAALRQVRDAHRLHLVSMPKPACPRSKMRAPS